MSCGQEEPPPWSREVRPCLALQQPLPEVSPNGGQGGRDAEAELGVSSAQGGVGRAGDGAGRGRGGATGAGGGPQTRLPSEEGRAGGEEWGEGEGAGGAPPHRQADAGPA